MTKNIFDGYIYFFLFTDNTAGKNSAPIHASLVRMLDPIEAKENKGYAIGPLGQVPGSHLTGTFLNFS